VTPDRIIRTEQDILVDKLKKLGSQQTFRRSDVETVFPGVTFIVGGVSDMYEVSESHTLHLFPGSDPTQMSFSIPSPTTFEERPTGIILEIVDESSEGGVRTQRIEPEIVEFNGFTDHTEDSEDGIVDIDNNAALDRDKGTYQYLLLTNQEGEVVYENITTK